MKEETQEADLLKNQKNKRAEAELSALDLLKKPLHEKKQEEGVVIYRLSWM